jgi:RING-box protein 1
MIKNIFKIDNVLLKFNTKCINIKNEDCAICRNPLLNKCIECQVNNEKSNSIKGCTSYGYHQFSVLGCCGHGYHRCCINKWCETRNVCPLDNEEWINNGYI